MSSLSFLDRCAARPSARWLVILTQSPSLRNQKFRVPADLAWACARAIARDTDHTAVLYGVYGRARFGHDGSGYVEWNSDSMMPGRRTEFDQRTIFPIH